MAVWIIFDFDDTLLLNTPKPPHFHSFGSPVTPSEDYTLSLYPDTMRVLNFLHNRGIPMALASFRTNADEALEDFKLNSYFEAIEFGQDGRTKVKMIEQLAKKLDLDPLDAVFYDDLQDNIDLCNSALIYSIKVNPAIGVTLEQIFKGIAANNLLPLYIQNQVNVSQSELTAFFSDYQVSFINIRINPTTVLTKAANHYPLILSMTKNRRQIYVLDLYTGRVRNNHLKVETDDLYTGLEELMMQFDQTGNESE